MTWAKIGGEIHKLCNVDKIIMDKDTSCFTIELITYTSTTDWNQRTIYYEYDGDLPPGILAEEINFQLTRRNKDFERLERLLCEEESITAHEVVEEKSVNDCIIEIATPDDVAGDTLGSIEQDCDYTFFIRKKYISAVTTTYSESGGSATYIVTIHFYCDGMNNLKSTQYYYIDFKDEVDKYMDYLKKKLDVK